MLSKPLFFAMAEIFNIIPPVAIPRCRRYGRGGSFVQVVPRLRLTPHIHYTADIFPHHTDYFGVFLPSPLDNPFGNTHGIIYTPASFDDVALELNGWRLVILQKVC